MKLSQLRITTLRSWSRYVGNVHIKSKHYHFCRELKHTSAYRIKENSKLKSEKTFYKQKNTFRGNMLSYDALENKNDIPMFVVGHPCLCESGHHTEQQLIWHRAKQCNKKNISFDFVMKKFKI